MHSKALYRALRARSDNLLSYDRAARLHAFPDGHTYKEHARTLFTFLDTPGFTISKYTIRDLDERLADIETITRQILYESHHRHYAA